MKQPLDIINLGDSFSVALKRFENFEKKLCSKHLFEAEFKNKVTLFALDEKIEFYFIPSYSLVFGGLWEAGVKSAKHYLKRVVENSNITYEE